MKTTLTALALLFTPLLPAPAHAAADTDAVAQQQEDCKQEEREQGVGEKTGAAVCAIKVLFQSRVRSKNESEPVEMTVGPPPMQSEDTDTPGPHNWEVNFLLNAQLAGSERRIEVPTLDLNYGVGDRIQLSYEVPYVFARQEQSDAGGGARVIEANGVGDSSFGFKYRFYDDEDSGLSLAIAPHLEFKTPGGNRDVSEHTTELAVPLVMTREFEHASVTANAGVELTSDTQRYFASFGAGRRISEHVALLAEVVGTDLNAADEQRVLLNLGARWKISEKDSLSAALGRDIHAGGDQREQTYFTFAYQKLFGK
ncbi:MAG TPA: transporter [Rudaea sp.]|nr:transporter [Rudaea sp.]